jgi:hypothetical protein
MDFIFTPISLFKHGATKSHGQSPQSLVVHCKKKYWCDADKLELSLS